MDSRFMEKLVIVKDGDSYRLVPYFEIRPHLSQKERELYGEPKA